MLEKLKGLLAEHHIFHYTAAGMIGVSPSMLSLMFKGTKKPDGTTEKKIKTIVDHLSEQPKPKDPFAGLKL